MAKGQELIQGRSNILFDLHAYEKWLINTPLTSIETRITNLKAKNFAVMFGEVTPMNAGTLMNPADFLKAARRQNITTTAWLWKWNGADPDALLDSTGNPNNNNNNNWGNQFQAFSLAPRSFSASVGSNPGYASDNDVNTMWSTEIAQTSGQTFTMNLGLSKSWNHIRLNMGNTPNNYPRAYTVSVSDDGVNWNATISGHGAPAITEIWPGTQTSRWIKITLDTPPADTTDPWSITEIMVE